MFAALGALADKRMGIMRNPIATLDALVMPLHFVLNDPFMAAAFRAVAD